jgi:hypothetical protein
MTTHETYNIAGFKQQFRRRKNLWNFKSFSKSPFLQTFFPIFLDFASQKDNSLYSSFIYFLSGGIVMKSLKGTQTEKNILTAFVGESQARNTYTYFASAAKKEG